MNLVRQSLRTRPPFGELGDPPLPADSNVLFEEEYCRVPITKSRKKRRKQDESFKPKDDKRILKTSSKKELSHADFVERLIIGKITFFLSLFFVSSYPENEVVAYRLILCIKRQKDKYFQQTYLCSYMSDYIQYHR